VTKFYTGEYSIDKVQNKTVPVSRLCGLYFIKLAKKYTC